MKKLLVLCLLFGLTTVLAEPAPEPAPGPEAEPEADPEAIPVSDPDAEPMYARWPYGYGSIGGIGAMPVIGSPRPVGTIGGYGGFGGSTSDVCGMTNLCCGMATTENCCLTPPPPPPVISVPAPPPVIKTKPVCRTIYERKCDSEDVPQCVVTSERDCHDFKVPQCRYQTNTESRQFTSTRCVPKTIKKCFDVEKDVCKSNTVPEDVSFTWADQVVKQSSGEAQTHCLPETIVNCTDITVPDTTMTQQTRERPVTRSERKCQTVPRRTPDQTTTVPVTRVVYNTMCYDVPRVSCQQATCAETPVCVQNTMPCTLNEFSTNTICPQPVASDVGMYPVAPQAVVGVQAACRQVRQPLCLETPICQAPAQQCCTTTTEKVCRQVPQRVVEQVQQVIPGTVTYEQQCADIPITDTETYVITVPVTTSRTKKQCESYSAPKCHEYTEPTFTIETEQKTKTLQVTVQASTCEPTTENVCVNVNTVECAEETITKQFTIKSIVCDQWVTTPNCAAIPTTKCTKGVTAKCQMVPRQVCQETSTCSTSQQCMDCNAFRNGPGFGTCATSTCGNFYPSDPAPLAGLGYATTSASSCTSGC